MKLSTCLRPTRCGFSSSNISLLRNLCVIVPCTSPVSLHISKVSCYYRHQIEDCVAALQNVVVNYKNIDLTRLTEAKERNNLPTFIINLVS